MTALQPPSPAAPAHVLDGQGIDRVLTRLAHEIREHHPEDFARVVIAGIREGGVVVARELALRLGAMWRHDVPLVALDVSGFRDDRPRQPAPFRAWEVLAGDPPPGHGEAGTRPREQQRRCAAEGPDGMVVVLVDDVIQTGRTMRAAFDLVASRGRPAAIEMAVLVDRGGREVPVRPNHVGRNLPVGPADWVEIRFGPGTGEPGIFVVPGR